MSITSTFTNMHTASQKLYSAAVGYSKAKKDLAKRFTANLDMSVKDERKIKGQVESFRKTENAKYFKSERGRLEDQRRAAFEQAKAEFRAASETLADAVAAFQPGFNVSDKDLQNALNIARIGKDLPEASARNLLLSLRTNKANFDIVKAALQRSGVDPNYIRGIYPFDGESMQYDYDTMVDDILSKSSSSSVYTELAKLESHLIKDGAAFGVNLSPIISQEDKDSAKEALTQRVMGLQSFDDVSALEML